MPSINDFPLFEICEPCRLLFNPRFVSDRLPWAPREILHYSGGGHHFQRARKAIENSAKSGCEICTYLLLGDESYLKDRSVQESVEIEDLFEESTEIKNLLEEPRPSWYPPEDEELEFIISRNRLERHELQVRPAKRMRWREPNSGGSWYLYSTPGDPVNVFETAKLITLTDIGSADGFAKVQRRLRDCIAHHSGCAANEAVELPTRVIELSANAQSARLRYVRGEKGRYIALSYCWGGPQPFRTVKSVLEAYLESLPYPNLPKTILDAFEVARGLGFRFVWIDSLCIIQDDPNDVQREMAAMIDVYANAQLTVSVSCAYSCTEGFLGIQFDSSELRYLPVRVNETKMGSILIADSAELWEVLTPYGQPLNSRAWTLQESLLSTRLLIFTGVEMFLKCRHKFEPELKDSKSLSGQWKRFSEKTGYPSDSCALNHLMAHLQQKPEKGDRHTLRGIYKLWMSIVENYADRDLTCEIDKLPAISGVADKFSSIFQCDYIAGLWRDNLFYDLLWSSGDEYGSTIPDPDDVRTLGYVAPSWSWASIRYQVHFNREIAAFSQSAEIVHYSVTLADAAAPFGVVTGGELILKGLLSVRMLDALPELDWLSWDVEDLSDAKTRGLSPADLGHTRVWFFVLGTESKREQVVEERAIGLVLEKIQPEECYRRTGLFLTEFKTGLHWWKDGSTVAVKIV